MQLSLKTLLPIAAIGTMALMACDSPSSKAESYMGERPRKEYLELTKSKNELLIQSKLDSMAYRDIFNGTSAAKDSIKVAEFNKIAAKMRPYIKTNNAWDNYKEINKKLVHNGITNKEFKKIEKTWSNFSTDTRNLLIRQHYADDWAYRKFFKKIGILDNKLIAKCDSISKIIRP